MCDYSTGPQTTSEQMVEYLGQGLAEIDDKQVYLLVSPSGSLLDLQEVPSRDRIIEILAAHPHSSYGFETRPETIHYRDILRIQTILGGRLRRVLLGIEAADTTYQRFCLNKNLNLAHCRNAFVDLAANEVQPAANVLLGLPFLTEAESIRAAVDTIVWSLNAGAGLCYVFPTHVKAATPVQALYQAGRFHPPSLWSLIAVMQFLEHESKSGKILPSWYSAMDAYNVIESPNTCPQCFDTILALLEHFDRWQDEGSLEQLFSFSCGCRDTWRARVAAQEEHKLPLPQRLMDGYTILAAGAGLQWNEWKQPIEQEIGASLNATHIMPRSFPYV